MFFWVCNVRLYYFSLRIWKKLPVSLRILFMQIPGPKGSWFICRPGLSNKCYAESWIYSDLDARCVGKRIYACNIHHLFGVLYCTSCRLSPTIVCSSFQLVLVFDRSSSRGFDGSRLIVSAVDVFVYVMIHLITCTVVTSWFVSRHSFSWSQAVVVNLVASTCGQETDCIRFLF